MDPVKKQRSTDSPAQHAAYYQALRSRDARFDGRVFVAVRTTGVYCRPICTARLPNPKNCTFFPLAALAEKNGYRPCLVCRPELAPGKDLFGDTRLPDTQAELAQKLMRRIEDGALNDLKLDELAAEFAITGRYLRVVLERFLGVTPTELAQTQRLLQAKQLLTETRLNITSVAYAAGFNSLRQFNHVFRQKYRTAPREFRTSVKFPESKSIKRFYECQQLRLDYRPPMNWQALLRFLGTRAIPGVEDVADGDYLRTIKMGEYSGWIKVEHNHSTGKSDTHSLKVSISDSLTPKLIPILAKVRGVFDVRANVFEIESSLATDPLLSKTIKKHSGMRLPGAFSGFELLLRAILGQQISVKGATTLAGRFAQSFGEKIETPFSALAYATPTAERLAEAKLSDIQAQGLPQKRAETIKLTAIAVSEGKLNLEPGADPKLSAENLIAIPGIGEWTADYVAMRALDWPDAFPSGDLGVKKALELSRKKEILARAEQWRPWRAYATMYLWLSLADT